MTAREVPAPPSARGAEGRHGGRAPARPEVTAVVLGISGIIMRLDVVLAKQKTMCSDATTLAQKQGRIV